MLCQNFKVDSFSTFKKMLRFRNFKPSSWYRYYLGE